MNDRNDCFFSGKMSSSHHTTRIKFIFIFMLPYLDNRFQDIAKIEEES